jgi:hypothetical protein
MNLFRSAIAILFAALCPWACVGQTINGVAVGMTLPPPSASTLGGIQSAAAVSHQWVNSISTLGVPALSQPAFADISGAATAGQIGTVPTGINGVAFSGLASGALCNTTGTGVPSICPSLAVSGSLTSGVGSGVGGSLTIAQGTLPSLTTNAISIIAPTSVTSYGLTLPGSAPAANQVLLFSAPSSGVSTATFANPALLGNTNVFSASSSSGVASLLNSGAWASGATSCHVLIQPAGTTAMTLAGGGAFCINAPTGNTANFITLTTNGSNGSAFVVSSNGSVGAYQLTLASGLFTPQVIFTSGFNNWSVMKSSADGLITMSNNAGTSFTRLMLGGTTSSFPALKRNAAVLQARLADDSAAGTFEGHHNSSDSTAGVTSSTCTAWKDGLCVTP